MRGGCWTTPSSATKKIQEGGCGGAQHSVEPAWDGEHRALIQALVSGVLAQAAPPSEQARMGQWFLASARALPHNGGSGIIWHIRQFC
mmetsp:Transcript_49318/g.102548  ORF Transcript_49318/g.102548 Transcript_49318/m.102548 type:complete len:88 (-) Transcript_49318:193-456(-)